MSFENKIFSANPKQKTITMFLKNFDNIQKIAIYKLKIEFNPEKLKNPKHHFLIKYFPNFSKTIYFCDRFWSSSTKKVCNIFKKYIYFQNNLIF